MWDVIRFILDYWFLLPILALGVAAYHFFGWKGVLAVATLGASGYLYRKGAVDQRNHMERQAEQARSEAIKQRREVDTHVDQMDDTTVHNRLDEWMRDRKR